MRWMLGGLLLAVAGCEGSEWVYVVDTLYLDDCQTGLGRGAELVLGMVEDDAGNATYTLEIPQLDLSVPCGDLDGSSPQVCVRALDGSVTERWHWDWEDDVFGVAVERTTPEGARCVSAATGRPWGTIADEDLETAGLVAGFVVAPPEVQLGAAVVLALGLAQFADGDLSIIADAGA